MTRKPSIPMTPSALPKQRSPEETVLPCRPEGFQGYSLPLSERKAARAGCSYTLRLRLPNSQVIDAQLC